MVQRESKIYNIKEIEKLLKKFANLPNKEKWEEIGVTFDKSGPAVRRWYYRQTAKQKQEIITKLQNNKEKEKEKEIKSDTKSIKSIKYSQSTKDIPTDVIRTVYLLLFGKGCRIGYYQAITEIKDFLEKL